MVNYPSVIISNSAEDKLYKDKLLKEAGLLKFADITESWDIPYSSKKLSYATHSIFRFYGKFPPPVASYLINKYTMPKDVILDPMVGSGTSAVEAILHNRKIVCADVNPLSDLLVKVKCQYLKEELLREVLEEINSKYKDRTFDGFKIKSITLDDKQIKHWFLPKTYKNLLKLLNIVNEIKNEKFKNVFYISFLSIIRKVSKATSLQGRLFLDVKSAIEDPIQEFNYMSNKIIKSVASLPDHSKPPTFLQDDIRTIKMSQYNPKLVICHPPYFNVYKFSSIFSLELGWMSCDRKLISSHEIREFFKVGKTENVHKYVEDMKDGILNIAKQLSRGNVIAIMIGDTRIRGEHIQTTRLLLDAIKDSKLNLISLAIRKPKYTEASWVASQRRTGEKVGVHISDFILVLRKTV